MGFATSVTTDLLVEITNQGRSHTCKMAHSAQNWRMQLPLPQLPPWGLPQATALLINTNA